MSVERIEISQGDVSFENFLSDKVEIRIEKTRVEDENVIFKLTDQQAKDLYAVLDVYLKSRDSL